MKKYKFDGKVISYGNKKHNKGFYVITDNRYKLGFEDARLAWDDDFIYRMDVCYVE